MKWSVDEFIEYLKTPPSSELDAFKRQNTVYTLFILLEALAAGEATFRDGILSLDDVQYDCKDHLPVTAVTTYGFGIGGEHAYDETVGRAAIGLLESVYLLRAESLVEGLEEKYAEICSAGPAEWNYYGSYLAHDSTLPEAMAARAATLFAPPAPVPQAQPEPAPVKPARFFSKGHTRRMHGRRALSPIKRTRATDTTRRRHNKSANTT